VKLNNIEDVFEVMQRKYLLDVCHALTLEDIIECVFSDLEFYRGKSEAYEKILGKIEVKVKYE
jgi:hypothetical protein